MYIPSGVTEAVEILNKSTNYIVYYDPDPDGLIAGSLVSKLLTDYGKPSIYYINENREHGFTIPIDKLEAYKGYTIIAVDFHISNDTLKAIVDAGLNIINIDHHDVKDTTLFTYSNNGYSAILINNQYEFEPVEYRFLSGAGVVYHTFLAMFPDYMNTKRNKALVGISLLSDIRETESNIAASYLDELYSWNDKYSMYLIDLALGGKKVSFGVQKYLDRNLLDFSLIPRLNALFRLNMGDTAIQVFNGIDVDVDLGIVRGEQQQIAEELMGRLTDHSMPGLSVMSVDIKGYEDKNYKITNFIGLVCGKIAGSMGQTAFLYVQDGDKIVRGSVRGKYDDVDYLSIFNKYGVNGAGHKGAFGVRECSISNIDFAGLVSEIEQAELVAKNSVEEAQRYNKVANLRVAINGETRIAKYNTYVRDAKRRFYDCSDCKWVVTYESPTKNYIQYSIDGVNVKCFDKAVTPSNGGYVMPLLNNGYVEYYLQKRVR